METEENISSQDEPEVATTEEAQQTSTEELDAAMDDSQTTSETTETADAESSLDAGEKAVRDFPKELRTLPGKWYVLHTYSGYEKRVKQNLEARIVTFGLEDKVFQI